MKYAKPILLIGLATIIWFAAFNQAAHDLWAASLVFLLTSILLSIYALFCFRKATRVHLPSGIPVLLVLGAVALSFSHAYDRDTALLESWGWFFAFGFFYLVLNTVEEEKDRDMFLTACGLVTVPLAVLCLWQQLTGHPDSWGHWEIQGTLVNSLVLSGFALNVLFLFWERSQLRDRPAQLIVLSCSIILVLARSSWAFICVGLGFVHYYQPLIIAWFKRHRRWGLGLAITMMVGLACLVAWKTLGHTGPYKGSSRLYYWLASIKLWHLSPWTGVGLGGYATAYSYVRDSHFQSTLYAHSFPLQWLSETGAVGVAALLAFIVSFYRKSRHSRYTTAILAVLFFSLISINLDYLLNKIMLLVTMAVALAGKKSASYPAKPLWIAVSAISLWLLSPFWMRLFFASREYVTGIHYESAGNIDLARQSYLRAATLDPYFSDPHVRLSQLDWQAYLRQGTPSLKESAIRSIEQAIECKNAFNSRILLQTYQAPHDRLPDRRLPD